MKPGLSFHGILADLADFTPKFFDRMKAGEFTLNHPLLKPLAWDST